MPPTIRRPRPELPLYAPTRPPEGRTARRLVGRHLNVRNLVLLVIAGKSAYDSATGVAQWLEPAAAPVALTDWQQLCVPAKQAMTRFCAEVARAQPVPYALLGLRQPVALAAACADAAQRTCAVDAAGGGVIVHNGMALAESLFMAPERTASETARSIDAAVQAAKHNGVAIVAETHFTQGSKAFRQRLFERSAASGDILLVEGRFFGQWFSDAAAAQGSTVRAKAAYTFSNGTFGGLEKPDTRFLGLVTYGLESMDDERFVRVMNDVQALAGAPDSHAVTDILAKIAAGAKKANPSARLAATLLALSGANDTEAQTLRTTASRAHKKHWDGLMHTLLDAMQALVAQRTGVDFVARAKDISADAAQKNRLLFDARLLWPRDQSFFEAIAQVRAQHPDRDVVAVMGAAHAPGVRALIDGDA